MARKLSEDEANIFGEVNIPNQAKTALTNEEKFIDALYQQREHPLELSAELRMWLEQAFPLKPG